MNESSCADLAVLVPAWNERPGLERLLPALSEVISRLGARADIIVIDNGSVDGTPDVATRLGARVVTQKERGYGGALLAGFEAARAPYIVTMDADLSHPPALIEEFWRRREEADLLIASRYVPGGGAEMSRLRLWLSVILNQTYRLVLVLPVRDVSSGFRMYHRDAVVGLEPVARDFDFLEEVLARIHRRGGRMLEIPFRYRSREAGQSHVRLLKFGWAFLKTLVRMWRLRWAAAARR